jgi:hypothetical protein
VTPTKAMAATHTTTRPPSCTAAASDSARCPPGNRARAVQVVAAVRPWPRRQVQVAELELGAVFFMDIFLFSTDQRQLRPGPAGRQPARGRDGWEGNLGHRTGLLAHGGGCARGRLCGAWRTHQGRICATLPWRARQPEGALVLADGGVSCQAHVG